MEENLSTTSNPKKKKQTSERSLVGGFGNYCGVHGCESAFYGKNRENTNISLFTLHKKHLRKKWLNVLKHFCRKGGED